MLPSLERGAGAPDFTAGLVDALSQMAFWMMGALTKLAADNDLSLTQLRVLAILRDRRPRMSDLVDHLGLEKSTLTGLVSRAEALGLVTRAPNPVDRRAVDVMLSDEGARLAEQLTDEFTRTLQSMLGSLDPSEQRALGQLLAKALT
ncbi:hypothetical protein GCM10027568_18610 [Humibacter soli]